MRRLGSLVVATVALLLALACVAAASATHRLLVGINESAGYEASVPTWFFPTMQSEGLSVNTLTLTWDYTAPTTIDPSQEAAVATDVQDDDAAGVTVELDLYPEYSESFTDGVKCAPSTNPQACGNTTAINAFAAWTAQVARAFPTVHDFIVMNECNQPLFINPQWNTAGKNQSAEICGRVLAASYTALKAEDPSNFVWGVGLSPRGNDNPNTTSNSSTSPVHFLEDLGAWFKSFVAATGRTQPLMDGLDFHPYPVPQSIPLDVGYRDVNDASIANLSRIYQAFYNGFHGSIQRTIGQQPGGGLPVSLNEMGIQTYETGQPGYTGVSLVDNANGGVRGKTATQAYQSAYYVGMLKTVACDPNVRVINLFLLVDDPDLGGWQSGLYEAPATPTGNPIPKLSATTVAQWIKTTGGECQGPLTPWSPSKTMMVSAKPLPPPTGPPSISSFSPRSAQPGATVTIKGGNLSEVRLVSFAGARSSFTEVSSGELIATVPPDAKSGKITIANTKGSSSSTAAFTVSVVRSPDGSGTLTTTTSSVANGSKGNTIVFTYTAASGGTADGSLRITVPAGWTPPVSANVAGCTSASVGILSAGGQTIAVSHLTLAASATVVVTYGATSGGKCASGDGVTAPATGGQASWQAEERSSASGTLTALGSSPSIDVDAADGSGTLTTPTTTLVAGVTGTTLVFTYTAASGGTDDGTLEITIPTGFSAPTAAAGVGCTTSSVGTVSVSGQTVTVSGLTLAAGATAVVTYGATSGGSCGAGDGASAASSAGTATFAASEASSASGTLTAIASPPAITIS